MDMEQRDYDSRTALHVAAAEGENNPNKNPKKSSRGSSTKLKGGKRLEDLFGVRC